MSSTMKNRPLPQAVPSKQDVRSADSQPTGPPLIPLNSQGKPGKPARWHDGKMLQSIEELDRVQFARNSRSDTISDIMGYPSSSASKMVEHD
jgi:hypothetical protein